jgi:hypothetical protein
VAYRKASAVLWVLVPALALGEGGAGDPAPSQDAAPPVHTLEERVAELREKLQRTRARLQELENDAGADVSHTSFVHRNDVGPGYRLASARYELDGQVVYSKDDAEGDLAGQRSIEVHDAWLPAGEHRLAVELVYVAVAAQARGDAADARFTVRATESFRATSRKAAVVMAVAYEREAIAGAEPRPAVRIGHALRFEAPAPPGD